MNAKQAEQCTGISRRNLRFYEQQGLIHPARNPANDYRDYSQQDIDTLKFIRALRMLTRRWRTSPPVSKGRPRLQIWPQPRKRDCSSDEKSWTSPLPFAANCKGRPRWTRPLWTVSCNRWMRRKHGPVCSWTGRPIIRKWPQRSTKNPFPLHPTTPSLQRPILPMCFSPTPTSTDPQSAHHQRGAGAGI